LESRLSAGGGSGCVLTLCERASVLPANCTWHSKFALVFSVQHHQRERKRGNVMVDECEILFTKMLLLVERDQISDLISPEINLI
jgi:hypothetical protein